MTLVFHARNLAILLIACCAQTISHDTVGQSQLSQDRSFYAGTPVSHPEWLSGIWEAPDGHGGMIGLHLMLDAAAPTDATTLVGASQSWLDLDAAIYYRSEGSFEISEINGFSDSPRGGDLRYAKGRLTLHDMEFDLDLLHIAGNRWSGRVHRKEFDSNVILTRPGYANKAKKPSLVGSWASKNGPSLSCLHIVESDSGKFLGWSDALLTWGLIQFARPMEKPPYSLEHYGALAKVQAAGKDKVNVELYAYSAGCCSHSFVATSAANSTIMKTFWPDGANQMPHRSEWKKMPGESCVGNPE